MPYVYVLSNPSYPEGTYKIGHTTKTMQERLAGLNNTSVPTPFKIEAQYEVLLSEYVEKQVHKHLKPYRLSKGREFFGNGITLDDIHLAIVHCCNTHGSTYSFGVDTLTPKGLIDATIAEAQSIATQAEAKKLAYDMRIAHEEALELENLLRLIDNTLYQINKYPSERSKRVNEITNTMRYLMFKRGLDTDAKLQKLEYLHVKNLKLLDLVIAGSAYSRYYYKNFDLTSLEFHSLNLPKDYKHKIYIDDYTCIKNHILTKVHCQLNNNRENT